jgi:hypothetical protein
VVAYFDMCRGQWYSVTRAGINSLPSFKNVNSKTQRFGTRSVGAKFLDFILVHMNVNKNAKKIFHELLINIFVP